MRFLYPLIAAVLKIPDPASLYGASLHNALLRLIGAGAIEAAALREHEGRIEVLLRKREPNATAYADMWHCPGSILRPTDESLAMVFDRLSKDESLGSVESFELVDNLIINEERGRMLDAIYLVRVSNPGPETKWFPVDALPEPMPPHHRDLIIPKAVKRFRAIY